MPETLEQVLADARRKLSRASLSTFAAESIDGCTFLGSETPRMSAFGRAKVGNPTDGKFGPRILVDMRVSESVACALYFLADPRFPRSPRYVGITTNVADRAKKHATLAMANPALDAWKRELRRAGLSAALHVLAVFPSPVEARAAEWRLIRRWRRRGLCDCNTPRDGEWDATKLCWASRNAKGWH